MSYANPLVILTVISGLCLGGHTASAQKAEDNLRIAFRDAITNIDPYYNNQRSGVILQQEAWDGLIYRDPDTFKLKPLLAVEWKLVDDTTIDFTLRQGVKFHDGSNFTADDVVYTLNLVSNPESKVSTPSNYEWVQAAEKIGEYSVRVKLKRPTPAALEFFALAIPIYPKAYREKVGADGYAKVPVGAGPYKITKVEPGVFVQFERFDGYWAGSPKGTPPIKKLSVRFVPDAATEMTLLLSQQADWVFNMNPDQFDKVDKFPGLQAKRQESMRIGYLRLDAAGRTGAGNPLTNVKVRQAIWHAIDRQSIADKLVTGGSQVPPAPCSPTQFGCDGEVAVRYDYNPAKAKALLTEAGFPEGFETELVSNMLPQLGASMQSYLQAVGIKARLTQLLVAASVQRSWKGETPLFFASYGSYSINDVSAILPVYFTGDKDDYAGDPELKKLVEEGSSTNDPAKRKLAYSAAIKRATEQAYWMPLFTYVMTYGFSKSLKFKPYSDDLARFYLASWN